MDTELNKGLLEANQIKTSKKTPVTSFIAFVAAIAVIGVSLCFENGSDFKMPLIFISTMLFIYGIAKFFSTDKIYIHTPSEEEMKMQILYFDSKEKYSIIDMLRKGETDKIKEKGSDNCDLPVKVELYSTDSGSIALYRVYNYIPYTFEPMTEYEVVKK